VYTVGPAVAGHVAAGDSKTYIGAAAAHPTLTQIATGTLHAESANVEGGVEIVAAVDEGRHRVISSDASDGVHVSLRWLSNHPPNSVIDAPSALVVVRVSALMRVPLEYVHELPLLIPPSLPSFDPLASFDSFFASVVVSIDGPHAAKNNTHTMALMRSTLLRSASLVRVRVGKRVREVDDGPVR
jgi:hypothetical protein